MPRKNRQVKYPPEVRKLMCKGCKHEIDDVGCYVACEYDFHSFGDRDPATVEVWVYTKNRVEPYTPSKKKPRRK